MSNCKKERKKESSEFFSRQQHGAISLYLMSVLYGDQEINHNAATQTQTQTQSHSTTRSHTPVLNSHCICIHSHTTTSFTDPNKKRKRNKSHILKIKSDFSPLFSAKRVIFAFWFLFLSDIVFSHLGLFPILFSGFCSSFGIYCLFL